MRTGEVRSQKLEARVQSEVKGQKPKAKRQNLGRPALVLELGPVAGEVRSQKLEARSQKCGCGTEMGR